MLTATVFPIDASNENTATVKDDVVMGVVTITVTDDTDKDDSSTGGNDNTGGEGTGGSSDSTGGNFGNMMEKTEVSAKN